MRPELFQLPEVLGGQPFPTYGLFLLLGVFATSLTFAWLAGREGASTSKSFEVTLETILVGILCARFGGLLLLPPETTWSVRVVLGSGGVWYFGLLGGLAYLSWRRRVLGLSWLETLDLMLPCAALGHALGRVGCFFAGCCWGRACDLPWAVSFPEDVAHRVTGVPTGVPLHPTQLYEAGAELLMGLLLIWWLLRHRRFVGQIALLHLSTYALVRFAVEGFRDDPRGALGLLSTSQAIAVAIFLVSAPLLAIAWRRGGLGRFSNPG